MPTRFSSDVEWLRPFYKLAEKQIPSKRITHVKGFKVSLGKEEQTLAQCTHYPNRTFGITILTHAQKRKPSGRRKMVSVGYKHRKVADVLIDFAHELAHTVHWEHTPEHWELENKLTRKFIREVKRRGIPDVSIRRPLK